MLAISVSREVGARCLKALSLRRSERTVVVRKTRANP
jgi:ribosomal protein L30/L7E